MKNFADIIPKGIIITLLFLTLSFLTGCDNLIVEELEQGANGSLEISTNFPHDISLTTTENNSNDISRVIVKVKEGNTYLIPGQELVQSKDGWAGLLENLPKGKKLTFIAHAFNNLSNENFIGTSTIILDDDTSSVSISMNFSDNNEEASLPQITKFTLPGEIEKSTQVMIGITVAGNNGGLLKYEIIPAGGVFNSEKGDITISGNNGTINLKFTAPQTIGIYNHTVKVTDKRGSYVSTSFETLIVDKAKETTEDQIPLIITDLNSEPNGTDLTLTAIVDSTGSPNELTYLWEFDNNLSFSNNTSNPSILLGYSPDVSGNLQLSVSDKNGKTTNVSYFLKDNHFQTDLIISPGDGLALNISVSGKHSCFFSGSFPFDLSGVGIIDKETLSKGGTVALEAIFGGLKDVINDDAPVTSVEGDLVVKDGKISGNIKLKWEVQGYSMWFNGDIEGLLSSPESEVASMAIEGQNIDTGASWTWMGWSEELGGTGTIKISSMK